MIRQTLILVTSALILALISSSDAKGFYTIVAPGSFRANTPYCVSLATSGLDKPMDMKITLTNGTYSVSKEVNVLPDAPQTAVLSIGQLKMYSYGYKLIVQGLNEIIFNETASLSFNSKQLSVFIQTDKAEYKASDKVRFRVLVVDADTKPYDLSKNSVTAWIVDPNNNRIKEWKNVKMTNGVFKNDMMLSREPALGTWTLYFQYGSDSNMVKTKSWQVAEYVLPKFAVTTSLPVYNTYKSGKLIFEVQAKYTYGKDVKGTATIEVQIQNYYDFRTGLRPRPSQNKYIKIVPINGNGTVVLELQKDLNIQTPESYTQTFSIQITVLEELTGISQVATANVPLYVYDYQVSTDNTATSFKPGLPFSFNVRVTRPDGKPVVDKQNPVKVSIFYGFNDTLKTDLTCILNDQGFALVSVTVPLSAPLLDFEITYKETMNKMYLNRAVSASNSFMQATVLTKPVDIFMTITVQVRATENMKYVQYQIVGRNGILMSSKVNGRNSKVLTFKFLAKFSMVPSVNLIVYYYRSDGEIVSDLVKITFQNRLDNFANISLSDTQLQPGQNVSITVDTKPKSYIGLLGIDQSVQLLRSGNDISQSIVFLELSQYNYNSGGYPDLPSLSRRPYTLTYFPNYQLFSSAGVIAFTNAQKYAVTRTESYSPINYIPSNSGTIRLGSTMPFARTTMLSRDIIQAPAESSSAGETTAVRTDFPETWIWMDIPDSQSGPVEFTKKVPDTITSWVITAFALNEANGLGLNANPTTLTVFKPFFVSMNLPYSVKRGEVLTMSVQIFNYLPSDQNVTVTLSNAGLQFDFNDKAYLGNSRKIVKKVASNTGSTISFSIIPRKVGYISIKITAVCSLAGDAIDQLLLVKPEGSPMYVNQAILLDLRKVNELKTSFTITPPSVAVPDSTSAEVSVFGDFMGNSIANLNNLIRIPSGCGEQNMLAFVPMIFVLDYLNAVQLLTPKLKLTAQSYMEIGYQQELNYRRFDGSFSCFGKSDPSGSTFLTAMVVRYFSEAKAKGYITIDDNVISQAMYWLLATQSQNGRFTEVGKVVHTDLQSDVGEGVGLTAYVLITMLTLPNAATTYSDPINRAQSYIIDRLQTVTDLYALAIGTYALQKAKNSAATYLLQRLNQAATIKNGLKWWEFHQINNCWYCHVNSVNIQVTAIALMIYAEVGEDAAAFPILQWLVKQRNSLGGYYSTQDTIFGLEALAKEASRLYTTSQNLDVKITFGTSDSYDVKVTKENAIALQSYELPLGTTNVDFECQGQGFAVAQVAYSYYVVVPEPAPRFNLDVTVVSSTSTSLNLTICTSFIPDSKANKSSMTIVEVSFPSGYTFNQDTLKEVQVTNDVSRVETSNANTVLSVYYYSIGTTEMCVKVQALRTSIVDLLKPAPVTVYDYYDNTKRARKFYSLTTDATPPQVFDYLASFDSYESD